MGRIQPGWLLAWVWLWALAAPAAAQRDVDIERFTPGLDADGFIGVQGTRTPGHLRYTLGLFGNYSLQPLELEAPGGEVGLVEHRIGGQVSAELGLGPRVAVAVALPLVFYQRDQAAAPLAAQLASAAVGDPRLVARYRMLGETAEQSVHRDGPGLAVQLDLRVPAGHDDAFAGEGAARLQAELLGDFHVLGAGVGGSVGLRHRYRGRQLPGARLRDEFVFGAALRLPVPPLSPLLGSLEIQGVSAFEAAATTVVEGQLGLQLPMDDLTFALAAGRRLVGGLGAPALRVVLGVWYRPAVSDTDGDGIADDDDACPPLPEDKDGFQDEDGCPDPDNDNDLIPDADDLCPNEEALEDQDEDEDGCTDPPR